MRRLVLSLLLVFSVGSLLAQTNNPKDPTWWDKYQYLIKNGEMAASGPTSSLSIGGNVDVSNECAPQSETYVTINTANAKQLAGGANEIFLDPMQRYWS